MNEKYIRKLIRLVEESEIESLEVSSWGRKVKITQASVSNSNGHSAAPVVQVASAPPVSAPPVQPATGSPEPTAESKAAKSNLVEITSPMVGTFYAAPSPESDPYVSINEKITAGQVVCIVEAMKLMNEIEAEVSGRIAEICVENGKPVEFGQVLYLIDPTG